MPKFPLKYLIDHGNGNYENALEIPKYKKYKNKKAIKKLMARRKLQIMILNKKNEINKTNIQKTETKRITSQIKTYRDILSLAASKKIIILKFIYNMGQTNIPRMHNNYCEFTYRINREYPEIKANFLLNKNEINEVLDFLNKNRKNMKGV